MVGRDQDMSAMSGFLLPKDENLYGWRQNVKRLEMERGSMR